MVATVLKYNVRYVLVEHPDTATVLANGVRQQDGKPFVERCKIFWKCPTS